MIPGFLNFVIHRFLHAGRSVQK